MGARKANFAEHQIFKGSQPLDLSGLTSSLQSMQVVGSSVSEEEETAQFQAWKKERLGKITGSRFGEVTRMKVNRKGKKVGDWSDSAMSLLFDLLGERLTGKGSKEVDTKSTQWGVENEPLALEEYRFARVGIEQNKKLIYLNDSELIGTTPDALFVNPQYGVKKSKKDNTIQGVIEIKCPYFTKNHLKVVLNNEIPDEYFNQCLGHLLVTGAKWLDFVSFDPRIKGKNRLHIIRLERDKVTDELSILEYDLLEFEKLLLEHRKKLGI